MRGGPPRCVCGECKLCKHRARNHRYRERRRLGIVRRQRWSPRPLRAALRRRGISELELERETGVSRRTMQRWQEVGVSDVHADVIASWLGMHPSEIWPAWFDAVVINEEEDEEVA